MNLRRWALVFRSVHFYLAYQFTAGGRRVCALGFFSRAAGWNQLVLSPLESTLKPLAEFNPRFQIELHRPYVAATLQ